MTPNAACPRRTQEWLPSGAEPPPCTWHHAGDEGLITVWPEEFTTNRAKWIPLGAWDQRK